MTTAVHRLKATAAKQPPKPKAVAKKGDKAAAAKTPKLDPKDQKAFDAALKKTLKARDKVQKELDDTVAKFKKQYLSDESLRATLLADFDGSGSLEDALADMLDELESTMAETFPEFLTMAG